jgi:hypothetical protein
MASGTAIAVALRADFGGNTFRPSGGLRRDRLVGRTVVRTGGLPGEAGILTARKLLHGYVHGLIHSQVSPYPSAMTCGGWVISSHHGADHPAAQFIPDLVRARHPLADKPESRPSHGRSRVPDHMTWQLPSVTLVRFRQRSRHWSCLGAPDVGIRPRRGAQQLAGDPSRVAPLLSATPLFREGRYGPGDP